ncbi:tumor necrosis factor receptor superfamily member 13B [Scophthalmus maximus]|uniref:TNFR-Cys domain-containing protein n=1 Tax=Scophthalmus maximus TaxID=52904 RepID=A0A8D3C3L6_SCOMX|nr:tumor necrosis factor receptor superfamily member 13B [Scophthalmus maximus]
MGGRCPEGQYWDALLKKCMRCGLVCQQPNVTTRCVSYCESANCKMLPGHFYDVLLRKCMRCANVCGKHPAECSHHCQTTSPPATTKRLMGKVTSHVPNSRGLSVPTALEDSSIFLYSLLALCTLLLFSSLSLALAIFLRGSRAKASHPAPKEAKHNRGCVVRPGEEVGRPGGQLGQTKSKDFVTSSSCPTDREPSDDSSPTETCVCVHCFPDLRALGQGSDRPPRAPLTFFQPPVLPLVQGAGPLWTNGSQHSSGLQGPGGGDGSSREMKFICSVSNPSVPQENWIG